MKSKIEREYELIDEFEEYYQEIQKNNLSQAMFYPTPKQIAIFWLQKIRGNDRQIITSLERIRSLHHNGKDVYVEINRIINYLDTNISSQA